MKIYTAAPPPALHCNSKYTPHSYVLNVCGVIYTTNTWDALYLPADDRRHYVAWSDTTYKELGGAKYFNKLYQWYYAGGFEHVAAYLDQRDISQFDPKAEPPKTEAFWKMVDTNRPTEDSDLAEAITRLGNPSALTLDCLSEVKPDLRHWLDNNIKEVPRLLRQCGYRVLLNPNEKKGMWFIAGERQRVYVQTELSGREQMAAARGLKTDRERKLNAERKRFLDDLL